MRADNVALPDVMLVLDAEGVIRDATLGNEFSGEPAAEWIGSPWVDTVIESDSEVLRRMLADARRSGVSAFHHLTQRFPSGLELPIEYTSVRLGDHGGLIAVGKNLRAVAELQARLVEAQQAMERDYWKLRDVETRYRLLFNSCNDAILLLKAADLTIAELNPAAAQAAGISAAQSKTLHEVRFPDLLLAQERELFESLVRRARERGKAPGILLRLGQEQTPCLARASLMVSAADAIILVQLVPSAAIRPPADEVDSVRIEDLVEGSPDGCVLPVSLHELPPPARYRGSPVLGDPEAPRCHCHPPPPPRPIWRRRPPPLPAGARPHPWVRAFPKHSGRGRLSWPAPMGCPRSLRACGWTTPA